MLLTVALFPAFLQTSTTLTCEKTGDTTLAHFGFEAVGGNQISFKPGQRSYDVWLPGLATSAVIRVRATDPDAPLGYNLAGAEGLIEGAWLGVGEGEVQLELRPGSSTLSISVKAPGGASGTYLAHITVGCGQCSDENECTTDVCEPILEVCSHTPVINGTVCGFDGADGVCIAGDCGPAEWRAVIQTSGDGNISSERFRMSVSVGGPITRGTAASASHAIKFHLPSSR